MDWSKRSIPAMRLEARFGDRLVPAFAERPKNIWAMISDAAARNPDGEALVCGERRMSWREVVKQSAQIAAGFEKLGLRSGDRVAVLLGNRIGHHRGDAFRPLAEGRHHTVAKAGLKSHRRNGVLRPVHDLPSLPLQLFFIS